MRIAIAADHHGRQLKAHLIGWLTTEGHQVDDRGAHDSEVVDYPPLCADLGRQILTGRADRGIVIGGTGGGEAIACNKIHGIRAGLCTSAYLAEISSGHNNTNVLVLGARVTTSEEAVAITERWLATAFKGGRHQLRLDQIAALERGESLA
ncbi:RpiB/LacA/LacB family sugar-phosphate isomerase [Micromonospora yasonensis]|uniref:RpiB/LacA/LacB family sugar-phosphate isomerase n=1 Tax=Micromonospora yasonensis TaxID=1128667 RepID=UPI00222F48E7|nr:RpiB/LacA/LacB family sugar-phosphate isomerase [Micromonospora yasonensis]MCW3840591.1 RpiB/LacA/LacB family sugar-phosphate isomerase [Micromonospora yasonensis]